MLQRWLCALCLMISAAVPSMATAGIITITDTEPMIDYPDCNCTDKDALPAVLPFALFDFSDQMQLATITGLEITLTMEDGDTGIGEFDEGNLTLQLDNVDTGIELNGFNAGEELTHTFSLDSTDPNWLSADILSDLILSLEDNQLFASIKDATPDDNFVNLYSVFDTTIRITGEMLSGGGSDPVPEPASLLVWGMAGVLAYRWKRRRQSSV